jgi:hypothetical protein
MNADFGGLTMLPIIGGDEELVRSYLKHFLLGADSAKEFEPYINDIYLQHLFAEVKIENGLGDAEQWASQLPPELWPAAITLQHLLLTRAAFCLSTLGYGAAAPRKVLDPRSSWVCR